MNRAPDVADLGFRVGDHVCAFYSEGGYSRDDIVLDYVTKGLRAGNKCVCMINEASPVQERIPRELVSRESSLQFFTEDEAYMPHGYFSKDAFLRSVEAMGKQAFSEGYERAWLLGEATFVIRRGVDVKSWFAAESWATEAETRYLHLILCLYNLDLFDGELVMYVLQTHPRIFVNGLIITNPHYIPARQFLASL
jgi:MEDS: MEthanogen/methylotroph, DcmR Sensory domain